MRDQTRTPRKRAPSAEYREETRDERATSGRKRARPCDIRQSVSICNTEKCNSYPDLPTPSRLCDSDHEMMMICGSPSTVTEFTHRVLEGKNPGNIADVYTSFSRTVASPTSVSVLNHDQMSQATASPALSDLRPPSNLRSEKTVADYAPTPSVSKGADESMQAVAHQGWKLGEPYYRSDGPARPPTTALPPVQMREWVYPPPGIQSG